MTSTSLVAAVVPRTDKMMKNCLSVSKGENLLQNGILYFVIKLNQSSEIALQS